MQYITRFCKSTDSNGSVHLVCLFVVADRVVQVVLLHFLLIACALLLLHLKNSNSGVHAKSVKCYTLHKSFLHILNSQ